MAQVIKEVTRELQAEKAKEEGRTTTIPSEDKQDKPERRCLPWRNTKAEEQLTKDIQEGDEDEENGTEKKGIFDVATKWKIAKNGKSLVRKRYAW
jgi:hypothetical protein